MSHIVIITTARSGLRTNLIILFLSLRPINEDMNIPAFTDDLMRLEQALRDGQPTGRMSLMRMPEQPESLLDERTTYPRLPADAARL